MGASEQRLMRQAREANARLRALSASGQPLERLAEKYNRIEDLGDAVKSIHRKVGERLKPYLRTFCTYNYDNSGLDTKSGKLRAAVANADIVVGLRGIFIRLGPANEQTYIAAGALQYGSIRGSKNKGRQRSAEKSRAAKRYAGNSQTTIGGTSYIPAHPFFELTQQQADQVEVKYAEFFQEELDAYLKRGA